MNIKKEMDKLNKVTIYVLTQTDVDINNGINKTDTLVFTDLQAAQQRLNDIASDSFALFRDQGYKLLNREDKDYDETIYQDKAMAYTLTSSWFLIYEQGRGDSNSQQVSIDTHEIEVEVK